MKNELKTFVAIGQNVWGKADNIYEAIRNAYKCGSTKNNRFVVYLSTDDATIDEVFGGISATELHKLGWFTNSGKALKVKD